MTTAILCREAAEYLLSVEDDLVEQIADQIIAEIGAYDLGRVPREETLVAIRNLFHFLINNLMAGDSAIEGLKDFSLSEIAAFESAVTVRRMRYRLELVDLLFGIKIFRDGLWQRLAEKYSPESIPGGQFFEMERRINFLLLYFIIGLSGAYLHSREELINSQREELEHWSEVMKSATRIDLKIPCRSEFALIARIQAEALARRCNCGEEEVQDIKCAVGEAVDNAIEHGCTTSGIDLYYHLDREHLVMEIQDYGPGFDPEGLGEEPPEPMEEGGRGIFLMRQLMDDVKIFSKKGYGTRVVLARKRIFL